MKEGWKAKKLVDICKIQYGYPFDSKQFCDDSKYPQLIRIRDVSRGYSETYYSGEIPEGYYIDKGDYLIGMDGEFNIAAWNSERALLNQRVCKITANDDAYDRFLYYNLRIILKQIEDETPFVTVKHLSAKRLNTVTINLPSLSEQQHIVEELDLLSSIIEKKKAQLNELDNLAKSLFYEMFGDPITNENGWEVDMLENVVANDCTISYGIVQPGDDVLDGIPVVRPVDLVTIVVEREGLKRVAKDISDSYKRTILKGGEILLCVRGTTGIMSFAFSNLAGCNVTRGITPLAFGDKLNKYYAFCYLKSKHIQDIIADNTRGATLKQINMKDVRQLPMLIPPIDLQNQFASKIEAIEHQKELIKQSIKEVETLFNSRMDYYFN